jgi:hypothetical protein
VDERCCLDRLIAGAARRQMAMRDGTQLLIRQLGESVEWHWRGG